jgi:hypothetical protein
MTENKPETRADRAPLTGVRSVYDVLRHLLAHGPARNDAEREELLGAVNAGDPGYTEPEHVMTAQEKAAEYDRLQAARPPATTPATPATGGSTP